MFININQIFIEIIYISIKNEFFSVETNNEFFIVKTLSLTNQLKYNYVNTIFIHNNRSYCFINTFYQYFLYLIFMNLYNSFINHNNILIYTD